MIKNVIDRAYLPYRMEPIPPKSKAKYRREAQKNQTQQWKNSHNRGEAIPKQKAYKRTRMKFT